MGTPFRPSGFDATPLKLQARWRSLLTQLNLYWRAYLTAIFIPSSTGQVSGQGPPRPRGHQNPSFRRRPGPRSSDAAGVGPDLPDPPARDTRGPGGKPDPAPGPAPDRSP